MAKVVFAEKALFDLDGIEAYIAKDSKERAKAFIEQFDETFYLLSQMPLMGRARNDLKTGVRMLVHRRYVILLRKLVRRKRVNLKV
jgi:toxin ParE1/3/4